MKTIVKGLIFPESLRIQNGVPYFVDMYDGRIFSLDNKQASRCVLHKETVIGGLGWLPNDELLFVDKPARKVFRHDGRNITVHADLSGQGESSLNDMLTLQSGISFVGEYGFDQQAGEKFKPGSIYRVDEKGSVSVSAEGLAFPNGMAVEANGQFIVAETMAQRLTKFDLSKDGRLSNRTVFHEFQDGYPDGLCIDRHNNIRVALIGPKSIDTINQEGARTNRQMFDSQPYDVVSISAERDIFLVAVSDGVAEDLLSKTPNRTGAVVKLIS